MKKLFLFLFILQAYGADYSTIRDELLLADDQAHGVTRLNQVSGNKDFRQLVDGKIWFLSYGTELYAYASESVDDTSWGCAWRAIQTTLTAYLRGVPTFKELYETYGGRPFMQEQLDELYPEYKDQQWLAPHETWNMWSDPVIGKMILHSLGIPSTLVSLNGIAPSKSPKVTDVTIDYKTFRRLVLQHFRKGGSPVMIDNSSYAMNILGAGKWGNHLYLLIGDPHLNFERDANPLNGLYVVELDRDGALVELVYPMIKNHFDPESYRAFNTFGNQNWNLLFAE
ncbi:MAG: hypothetical protein KDK65_02620 [Chlamydiia bacterium]|nr:hypothetical protein [Chlamydiia bacterium]